MIGWPAGFRSYHVGGFEGVPLAADAPGNTETKARVLLYSHAQLQREEGETQEEKQKNTKTTESEI